MASRRLSKAHYLKIFKSDIEEELKWGDGTASVSNIFEALEAIATNKTFRAKMVKKYPDAVGRVRATKKKPARKSK